MGRILVIDDDPAMRGGGDLSTGMAVIEPKLRILPRIIAYNRRNDDEIVPDDR